MHSSTVSAPCRFELRPSRWLIGAMVALAALAPFSVLRSEMPAWIAWPLAVVACVWGLWLSIREARRPNLQLTVDPQSGATVSGRPVHGFAIDWRGPLLFLSWSDAGGRRQRRSVWPDVLDARTRRELRLAASALDAVREGGPMAP
ncbi:MAG: hypothetical protein E6Q88_06625 [Lysobacteraceae bacterium]|nr:MAG: hypothetical protein E6Q88_06625 [Xanthomonadaceae bacterium]